MLLIDTHYFLYKYFWGLPIYEQPELYLIIIARLSLYLLELQYRHPESCIKIILDSKGSCEYRRLLYANYKIKRPPTPLDIKKAKLFITTAMEVLGLGVYSDNTLESDDIIGKISMVHSAYKGAMGKLIVVTPDKDLLQVLDYCKHILVYRPHLGEIWDQNKFIEIYGLLPSQFLDYLAIIGDSSDNVSGAPGIGPIGAKKLFKQYDSLYSIIVASRQVNRADSKLLDIIYNNQYQILLARRVIQLRSLPSADVKNFYSEKSCKVTPANIIKLFRAIQIYNKFLLRELMAIFRKWHKI
jgi:DNA polymerase-1